MRVDRSLQEVWDWKDKVYRETKGLTMKEMIKNIKMSAECFREKYGIQLRKSSITQK